MEASAREVVELQFQGPLLDSAFRYYSEGRVSLMNDGGDAVSALVLGTRPSPYRVSLTLGDGYKVVASKCSCAEDDTCKHVAATLFAVVSADHGEPPARSFSEVKKKQEQEPPSETRLEAELRELEELLESSSPGTTRSPGTPSIGAKQIVYVLLPPDVATQDPNARIFLPLWEILEQDFTEEGWGPPRKVDPKRPWLTPRLTLPIDQSLGGLVEEVMAEEPEPIVIGALLRSAVKTGRVVFGESGEGPFRWGKPRSLDFRWTLLGDGSRRLDPCLSAEGENDAVAESQRAVSVSEAQEPGVVAVLNSEPLLYFDLQQFVIGSVATDLSREVVAQALCLAPAPFRLSPAVRELLDRTAKSVGAPPLSNLKVKTVKAAPKGHLYATVGRDEDQTPIPVIEVEFQYGEARVSANSDATEVSRTEGDSLHVSKRDPAAEAKLIEEVLALDIEGATLETVAQTRRLEFLPNDWEGAIRAQNQLREAGFEVTVDTGCPISLEYSDEWYFDLSETVGGQWFDWKVGAKVGGKDVDLGAALGLLLEKHTPEKLFALTKRRKLIELPHQNGGSVWVESERLRVILDALVGMLDTKEGPQLGFARASGVASALADQAVELRAHKTLRKRMMTLVEPSEKPRAAPRGLRAELRPYQQVGYQWLRRLYDAGLGGVLADDMGLGKTIQFLSHLLALKVARKLDKPALVVAPTSVLHNWKNEAERFTPSIEALVYRGPDRVKRLAAASPNLIITNYAVLVRDSVQLQANEYSLVCFDEAQFVKNVKAKATQVAGSLRADQIICMTGTPVENHLGELWSVMSIGVPGLLGTAKEFNKHFRKPIESPRGKSVVDESASDRTAGEEQDLTQAKERLSLLRRRIGPFLLRRRKSEVALELPEKVVQTRVIPLNSTQRDLYETVRATMHQKVRDAIANQGFGRSKIVVLDALLKLRQVCCHPALIKKGLSADATKVAKNAESAKLDELLSLLSQLTEEGRSVLVFSQFVKMLELVEQGCADAGVGTLKLTGQTKKRDEIVKSFQAGEAPVFLVSLKAGGTGLNLTQADTVIHYDPWWNPAVEDQATDRAHRIGQNKTVFVHRLVAEGTVEEKMIALGERKRALADGAIEGVGDVPLSLSDLDTLFEPLS